MTQSIRFGKLTFEQVGVHVAERGKRRIETPLYRCPLCKRGARTLRWASIAKHLATHDAREEWKRLTVVKRELGMTDPVVGQTGFAALGFDVVRPKQKKR